MKSKLIKRQKLDTPRVYFDSETGILELSGSCFTTDPYMFFKPLNNWIREYCESPQPKTELICNLTYLNTAAVKQFWFTMSLFEKILPPNEFLIKWYYPEEEDDEIYEIGKSLEKSFGLGVEFIKIEE